MAIALPALAAALILSAGGEELPVTPEAIFSVAAIPGEPAAVGLQLMPAETTRFRAMTRAHRGQALGLILCGQEIEGPPVEAEVENGLVILPTGTAEVANRLAEVISGKRPCPGG